MKMLFNALSDWFSSVINRSGLFYHPAPCDTVICGALGAPITIRAAHHELLMDESCY